MSQLISRILLTVLIFPATVLFYCVAFILLEELVIDDGEETVVITAVVSAAFMIGYWCLLWRKSVNWTAQRMKRTLLSLGGAAVAGGMIGAAVYFVLPYEQFIGGFLGIACGSVIWIIMTIVLWRETTEERAARLRGVRDAIVCPNCGYNLTGLAGTRCPECGSQYTIDELLAEQPGRVTVEVEAG
jgi:hypothetical protein